MAFPSAGYSLGDTETEHHEARATWAAVAHAVLEFEPVTVVVDPAELAAARRYLSADVEIVEAHHRMKVDAPSGTALMLGQAAAEGRGIALEGHSDSGRDGITGARKRGNIGFSAIRGGDIVGELHVFGSASRRSAIDLSGLRSSISQTASAATRPSS